MCGYKEPKYNSSTYFGVEFQAQLAVLRAQLKAMFKAIRAELEAWFRRFRSAILRWVLWIAVSSA